MRSGRCWRSTRQRRRPSRLWVDRMLLAKTCLPPSLPSRAAIIGSSLRSTNPSPSLTAAPRPTSPPPAPCCSRSTTRPAAALIRRASSASRSPLAPPRCSLRSTTAMTYRPCQGLMPSREKCMGSALRVRAPRCSGSLSRSTLWRSLSRQSAMSPPPSLTRESPRLMRSAARCFGSGTEVGRMFTS